MDEQPPEEEKKQPSASSEVFSDLGVEVTLKNDEAFLLIKETLQRIGVSAKKDKILYQSCHILHKRGKYAIVHFKEMFLMDGKESNISENDLGRRNTITKLLEEWGLVTIKEKAVIEKNLTPVSQIKIISFKEKSEWELVPKYQIGAKKKQQDS